MNEKDKIERINMYGSTVLSGNKAQWKEYMRRLEELETFKLTGPLGEEEFTIFDDKPVYLENGFRTGNGCDLSPKQITVFDKMMNSKNAGDSKTFENCKSIFKENYPIEYKKLLMENFKMETESNVYHV